MTALPTPATFLGLSTGELIVVLVIVLILFGGANLPRLSRSLGQSIKEFKKAVKDEGDGADKGDEGGQEKK